MKRRKNDDTASYTIYVQIHAQMESRVVVFFVHSIPRLSVDYLEKGGTALVAAAALGCARGFGWTLAAWMARFSS